MVVSLSRQVRKVCKAFLTESGLEGVWMQARLPPATEALAVNRAGWSHCNKPQLILHFRSQYTLTDRRALEQLAKS